MQSDVSDCGDSLDIPKSISIDSKSSSTTTSCGKNNKNKANLCFTIIKDKYEYKNKKSNKNNKLKNRWSKLDDRWNKILLQEDDSITFVKKDVLGDGNCQFRSIEKALKNESKTKERYFDGITHKNLRQLISDFIINQLSDDEFNMIIDSYKMEKDSGEFMGYWDPYKIKNKMDFAKQIRKTGFHFQGDDITLMLLSRSLNVDFIILNEESYTINQLSELHPSIIILMYKKIHMAGGHYQLIGIRKNKNIVDTIFNRDFLPDILQNILNKEKYLHEHVKKCYQNISANKFTLINVYNYLKQEVLNRKLRKSEKQVISNLLQEFVQKIKVKKLKK
jgi:hypothetical protein